MSRLDEVEAMDSDEMVKGYFCGFKGEQCNPGEVSEAFLHGWGNGIADKTGETDSDQRALAAEYVERYHS